MGSEIWKDVVGYEGLYQVSNLGRIKRLPSIVKNRYIKGGLLNPRKHNYGYLSVYLCKNGVCEQWLLHRIVAIAFIPNPKNLPQINHKDSNRRNNFASNLEWVTRSQNIKHAYDNRLNKKARPVECLKDGVVIKTYQSALEAEKVDGFSSRNIAHCCNHRYRHKRHKGFEWRYVTTKQ